MRNKNLKIIILAAGKGVRMKSEDPKALTKLKGKSFLEHILDTIKEFDPEIKPIVVVGYKKERIKEVLGENHNYVVQEEQLGTGHAVRTGAQAIQDASDTVLILSADQ